MLCCLYLVFDGMPIRIITAQTDPRILTRLYDNGTRVANMNVHSLTKMNPAGNIHYDIAERAHGLAYSGIGGIHSDGFVSLNIKSLVCFVASGKRTMERKV